MPSLILVTCDSGAGHLKRDKRADRILAITHRVVTGPVPVGGPPETFFQRQRSLYEAEGLFHEPWRFETDDASKTLPVLDWSWNGLPEICRQYDPVELWIDPDPNAQLLLLQLLNWLGTIPEIAPRLWLKQSDSALGERRPGDWALLPRPVEAADIALARRAWAAFGAPTPEAWAGLFAAPDLDRLPGMPRAVELMLRELPDATGLGATERRILALAEREGRWIAAEQRGTDISSRTLPDEARRAGRLIRRTLTWGERLALGYWELGEAICYLAAAPAPALCGITEHHFSLEAHDDPERYRRFVESPVRLTDFGHSLVAGTDDWSRHNPVHRWLGGTRLTNNALWRWDEASRKLSAPHWPKCNRHPEASQRFS